jgi:hypothetical protein
MTKPIIKKPHATYEPPFDELTLGEKFKYYPAYCIWVMALILFAGLPGIVMTTRMFLSSSSFVASTALQDFAMISSIPIAMLAYGPLFLHIPKGAKDWLISSRHSKITMRIISYSLGPIFLAFMWILFLQWPVSLLLHAASPKEEQRMVEDFRRYEGRADPIDVECGRTNGWAQVQLSGSFWWPRAVCNISHDKLRQYSNGGTITLQGKVSRYGITSSSYELSSRQAKR